MIEIEQVGEVKRFRLGRTIWGRTWYVTGAYWVDGLMVDTGCAYTVQELVAALHGSTVDRIVNTHSHEDHIAGNAALQAAFGSDILVHREAVHFLADPRKTRLRPYQRVLWGYPAPSNASAIGEVLETRHLSFQVIHTPGHSPDHVCLYEPERGWLFTGDAYVGGRDRALRQDYNIWQIIASLKKLASLRPKVLFAGSGTVRFDAAEELATKIEYLEGIGARVLELHSAGTSTRGIGATLFGPEMPICYLTLGHFSGRNLVRSYIEDRAEP